MKWYLSFTNEEVFQGVALPEKEEEESPQTPGTTNFPEAHCMPEPVPEGTAPKVCGMGEGVAPILTSVGHQGYPSTNQDPKAEGEIEPDLPNDTHKATSLPSEDPYSTSALSVNTGLGAHAGANPATWLLRSDGLSAYSRTCRGGPRSTSRCHAHWTIGNPWDL